jgi:hypothetical protein
MGSMFLFHTQSFSSFSVYLLFLTIIFNLVFLSIKALGLAYQKLGMYTAATKVRFLFVPFSYCLTLHSCDFIFQINNARNHWLSYSPQQFNQSYGRAIELEDRRVFALIQSGNIFLTLGNFRKVLFLCLIFNTWSTEVSQCSASYVHISTFPQLENEHA